MDEEFFNYKNIICHNLKEFLTKNASVFITKVCDIKEEMYDKLKHSFMVIAPYLESSITVLTDCCQLNKVMSQNKIMYTNLINNKFKSRLETINCKMNFLNQRVVNNKISTINKKLSTDLKESIKTKQTLVAKKDEEILNLKNQIIKNKNESKKNMKRKLELMLALDDSMINNVENIVLKKQKI